MDYSGWPFGLIQQDSLPKGFARMLDLAAQDTHRLGLYIMQSSETSCFEVFLEIRKL